MRLLDFDWRRLARWCLLGTLVMTIWLLVPTVKCSYHAFADTPLTDGSESGDVSEADKVRVEQGTGFFSKLGGAAKQCYQAKPLLGQEAWKRDLLLGFLGLMIVAWALDRVEKRRKRTYER